MLGLKAAQDDPTGVNRFLGRLERLATRFDPVWGVASCDYVVVGPRRLAFGLYDQFEFRQRISHHTK
jgi:hypothetical protein